MLEGNRIHEELKLRNVLKHINLNVPEAIKYAGNQASKMTEWVKFYTLRFYQIMINCFDFTTKLK